MSDTKEEFKIVSTPPNGRACCLCAKIVSSTEHGFYAYNRAHGIDSAHRIICNGCTATSSLFERLTPEQVEHFYGPPSQPASDARFEDDDVHNEQQGGKRTRQ